jgi:RNA polymerase sigma-70 factor (ECF subfamily)
MPATRIAEANLNALIEEKSDGAFAGFRDFYCGNQEYIRNILFRLGIDSELEDVLQNTFIKAWHKIDQFEKKSNIKTWLTKIAINSAYEHFRKAKGFASKQVEIVSSHDPSKDNENRELVRRALNALSLDHRIIVVLCTIEEYSLEEAAKILRIPIGTAKSRLNRARKSMQEYLQKMEATYE